MNYGNLCWVEEFLLGKDKLEQSRAFQPLEKQKKNPHLNRSGQVFQFHCELSLLFTVKRHCSVFRRDLKRVSE